MRLEPAVAGYGARLTLDEFLAEFQAAWSRLRSRVLKVETWQSYQDEIELSCRAQDDCVAWIGAGDG